MNDKPENKTEEAPKWDWVTERSSCTYPKVFSALLSDVEADVKSRNALRPQNAPYEFSVEEKGSEFAVVLQAKDVRKSVTFVLADHAIIVRADDESFKFEVALAFSRDGKCKLKVNDEDRNRWQVRRMALEDLFFPNY
jgi:hypothetical protein